MKKYLLVLFLTIGCITVHGQSINLLNLANLTTYTNQQAADDLTARRVFKLQFGEEVNGFVVEHYQTTAPANKIETVIIGTGFKMANGSVLHTVSYISGDPQNVVNLMGQAKSANLLLSFRGSDKEDNIYIYDSFLYHVVVRISLKQARGVIDISQKQVFAQ